MSTAQRYNVANIQSYMYLQVMMCGVSPQAVLVAAYKIFLWFIRRFKRWQWYQRADSCWVLYKHQTGRYIIHTNDTIQLYNHTHLL